MLKLSFEQFNTLPTDVQQKIKSTLTAYNECTVTFEDGQYQYDNCLKANYADDYKYLGTISKNDIFTEIEQIENYINNFHSYPKNYKGNRDYSLIKKMDERDIDMKNKTISSYIGKINNEGNFKITGTITSKF